MLKVKCLREETKILLIWSDRVVDWLGKLFFCQERYAVFSLNMFLPGVYEAWENFYIFIFLCREHNKIYPRYRSCQSHICIYMVIGCPGPFRGSLCKYAGNNCDWFDVWLCLSFVPCQFFTKERKVQTFSETNILLWLVTLFVRYNIKVHWVELHVQTLSKIKTTQYKTAY